MALSIRQLYEATKRKYRLKLMAGETGLGNVVSWVHYMEDIKTTSFIRGHELIITTGMGYDGEEWLLTLVRDLYAQNAAGLIVNVGEYIREIPKAVEACAEELHFPIFTMPWEIHLVDIMQEYCNEIMRTEQAENRITEHFERVFFAGEEPEREYFYDNGYGEEGYCVLRVRVEKQPGDSEVAENYVRHNIEKVLNRYLDKYSILMKNGEICICLYHVKNLSDISRELQDRLNHDYSGRVIRLGISREREGLAELHRLYKEAGAALRMAVIQDCAGLSYAEIGVGRILLAVEDSVVLEEIYQEQLGVLEAYDQKSRTEYVELLYWYLRYDSCIQKVAEKTFIHRNTVNYRIRKIKEILGRDLSDARVRYELDLAYGIRELLKAGV